MDNDCVSVGGYGTLLIVVRLTFPIDRSVGVIEALCVPSVKVIPL